VCTEYSLLNESESSERVLTECLYVKFCFVLCFVEFGVCGQVQLREVMAERQNTVVCSFDPSSPHINAYDIHEWLHAALRIQESTVSMIEIDGINDKFSLNL